MTARLFLEAPKRGRGSVHRQSGLASCGDEPPGRRWERLASECCRSSSAGRRYCPSAGDLPVPAHGEALGRQRQRRWWLARRRAPTARCRGLAPHARGLDEGASELLWAGRRPAAPSDARRPAILATGSRTVLKCSKEQRRRVSLASDGLRHVLPVARRPPSHSVRPADGRVAARGAGSMTRGKRGEPRGFAGLSGIMTLAVRRLGGAASPAAPRLHWTNER